MRILIAGGGPAGLTFAACLRQHGIDCTIVEKAAKGRAAGYSIGLHVNGWNVAERLGLVEHFKEKAMPLGPALHRDTAGKTLFSYDYRTLAHASGGRMLAIMRQSFQDIVTRHIEANVDIRYETTISALSDDGAGVDVTFSSGDRERFDLVVAADGYRSALRALVFGPHEDFLRPLGYRASAWRMPVGQPLGASFVGMMDVDHQGGLYDIGDGHAATLFCWRDDRTDRLDADARQKVLREHFGHWPEPVGSALEASIDWDNAFFDTVSQIDVPKWSKGRVVLLGDAAWCLTFLAGRAHRQPWLAPIFWQRNWRANRTKQPSMPTRHGYAHWSRKCRRSPERSAATISRRAISACGFRRGSCRSCCRGRSFDWPRDSFPRQPSISTGPEH